jgi:hypothetical protein
MWYVDKGIIKHQSLMKFFNNLNKPSLLLSAYTQMKRISHRHHHVLLPRNIQVFSRVLQTAASAQLLLMRPNSQSMRINIFKQRGHFFPFCRCARNCIHRAGEWPLKKPRPNEVICVAAGTLIATCCYLTTRPVRPVTCLR